MVKRGMFVNLSKKKLKKMCASAIENLVVSKSISLTQSYLCVLQDGVHK